MNATEVRFSRALVIGTLLSVAVLLAATTLRGTSTGTNASHDDRPVLLDR